MLDQAFEALKTFDWGADYSVLKPIDEAVRQTHGDPEARRELASRLAAVLKTDGPLAAKDYVCRKLVLAGSAESVPALASLLPAKETSHLARYALERIEAVEAAEALREALRSLGGELKIGVIASLGTRADVLSISALKELLADADPKVACAAAYALGAIRTAEAAKALAEAMPSEGPARRAAVDASFACAEKLLSLGRKDEALAIYKGFAGEDQPAHVRVAATRGVLACAGS